MSYTIPEDVIGIPLFVPTAHDYFSIGEGEMPNGEDCLVVHGDVSTNYKAFQAAQTLSPNLFLSRAANPWSISFWIYGAAFTTPPGSYNGIANTLLGVQRAPGPNSYSDTSNFVWNIGKRVDANNRLSLCANSGGGEAFSATVFNSAWHLCVFTKDLTTFRSYTDDAVGSTSSFTVSGVPPTTEMFFSIGAYGVNAACTSYNREWKIGKLAFHSHQLNSTERSLLYAQMMGV